MNGIVDDSGLTHSEGMTALAKALLLAQKNMDPVLKDAMNPAYKTKYADLSSVLDAVKPALQSAGIVLIQGPFASYDDGHATVGVDTMLLHESGEWMRTRLSLQPTKSDPQGAGSAITYARRYSALSMCGVAPEDDDGAAASAPAKQQRAKPAPVEPPANGETKTNPNAPGSISPGVLNRITELCAIHNLGNEQQRGALVKATKGRLSNPDPAILRQLSQNEGLALGPLLKAIGEAQPCPLCTALPGEAHYRDDESGEFCRNDSSDAAVAFFANQSERLQDIQQESLL